MAVRILDSKIVNLQQALIPPHIHLASSFSLSGTNCCIRWESAYWIVKLYICSKPQSCHTYSYCTPGQFFFIVELVFTYSIGSETRHTVYSDHFLCSNCDRIGFYKKIQIFFTHLKSSQSILVRTDPWNSLGCSGGSTAEMSPMLKLDDKLGLFFFLTYSPPGPILYSIHRAICRPSDHSVGRPRAEIRSRDRQIYCSGRDTNH